MDEDPRYLRNESRRAHQRFRRMKKSARWSIALWLIVLGALITVAIVDVMFDRGWGYQPEDIWGGLLMMPAGMCIWACCNRINDVILAASRRRFGPEPAGPIES